MVMNFEAISKRLMEVKDSTAKLQIVSEIRESLETILSQPNDYPVFLRFIFPCFYNILRQGKPQLADNFNPVEHKLRNMILEILHRLPNTDHMRTYAKNLLKLAMYLLEVENEENAVIAVKIISDIHKAFRPNLEEEVQPFLEIVYKMYSELPQTVDRVFKEKPPTPAPTPGAPAAAAAGAPTGSPIAVTAAAGATATLLGVPSDTPSKPQALTRGLHSFQVLKELPIIVVYLFQLYPRTLPTNLQKLLPLMFAALGLQAPPTARTTHRALFNEFVYAQVKTLSFLAWMCKASLEHVRAYQEVLPKCVVQLLHNCPNESTLIRKELLYSMRHFLTTDLRMHFIPHVDALLDDKVLLGPSRPGIEALRLVASTTIGEFVHQVRMELSLSQLARAVQMFARNVHDPSVSFDQQAVAVKLLSHVADAIYRKSDLEGKPQLLLLRMFDTFVNKFASLKRQIPQLLAAAKGDAASSLATAATERDLQPATAIALTTATTTATATGTCTTPTTTPTATTAPTGSGTKERTVEIAAVRECRGLVRALIQGLRAIVHVLPNASTNLLRMATPGSAPSGVDPQQLATKNRALASEEAVLAARLLKNGIKCFAIYEDPTGGAATGPAGVPSLAPEDKLELLIDHFATVFTFFDSRVFHDVLTYQMPLLYQAALDNKLMLGFPQQFFSNHSTSRTCAEVLLAFLVERMDKLAGPPPSSHRQGEPSILLRLFKQVFGSLAVFADNEPVVQPHLATIVSTCLRSAAELEEPYNYFVVLRSLFRTINGGKFDLLIKELTPLIPSLFDTLSRLLQGPHSQKSRHLFIELSLTVPLRMTALVHHLPMVMHPLLLAIQSAHTDLVIHGLKVLESLVDLLLPELLDEVMAPIVNELMPALLAHLRPAPYPHGPLALKVLAKLGGRNRQFLANPRPATLRDRSDDALKVTMRFEGGESITVPLGRTIELAQRLLLSPPTATPVDTASKEHAFVLLRAGIIAMLNVRDKLDVSWLTSLAASAPKGGEAMDVDGEVEHYPLRIELSAPMGEKSDAAIKTREELMGETELLRKMIATVIRAAGAVEALKDKATSLATSLSHHFAVLLATKRQPAKRTLLEIDPTVYLDALCDALSSKQKEHVKPALHALDVLLETISKLLAGNAKAMLALPALEMLAQKFCHLCYMPTWHEKNGGTMGIVHLCSKTPQSWVRRFEVDFVRALLFVIKDLPPETSVATTEEATACLQQVLKNCHAITAADEAKQGEHQRALHDVVATLAAELSSPHPAVRKNVQKSLEQLAELSGSEISELLEAHKATLLAPILSSRVLRATAATSLPPAPSASATAQPSSAAASATSATSQTPTTPTQASIPLQVQTGFMDCLTFCLTLRPPLLTAIPPEVMKVLQDALVLAEAEETTGPIRLAAAHDQSLATQAKTVAIELLSAAMACVEFSKPEHNDFRNRAIGVFFKALTLRTKEIVRVAKRGLSQVIAQSKLPKDLLQQSLRPVLLNLADHRKLSVPLLKGLARLLELLTNCFNVTLGEKLLEHLAKWADPNKMAASKGWKDGEEIKIAAAIVHVFYLLPPAANKFLEPLVALTLQLEQQLPRDLSSPYRPPLIKFLNRYPQEAVDFFLEHLSSQFHAKMFRFIVRSEQAAPLRDELARNPQKLIAATFHYNKPAGPGGIVELVFQGVCLVRTLVKFNPQWLVQNPAVMECLLTQWRSNAQLNRAKVASGEEPLQPLFFTQEPKLLTKCFLAYCRAKRDEVDLLFHMLAVFTARSTVDFTFLREFYHNEVPSEAYTLAQKKAIMARFLSFFKDPTFSPEHKVHALQTLVTPLLTAAFDRNEGTQLLDSQLVAQLIHAILEHSSKPFDESLNIELLQLLALLVRYMPQGIIDHRKEVIRFAWQYFRSEDLTAKHWGYILTARFVEAYDNPHKIILHIYAALLKAHQAEARSLVNTALDILVPALKKRLPPSSPAEAACPTWIKYTKKVLIEESHQHSQLIHILHLLVRHPDVFYPYRSQFINQTASMLTRLGLIQGASIEHRKLAIDLVDLIISWERRRLKEAEEEAARKAAGAAPEGPEPVVQSEHAAEKKAETEDMAIDEKSDTATPMETDMSQATAAASTGSIAASGSAASTTSTTPQPEEEDYPTQPRREVIINFLMRVSMMINQPQQVQAGTTAAERSREATILPLRALDLLKRAIALWPDTMIKFHYFEKILAPVNEQPHFVLTGLTILNSILDYQLHSFLHAHVSSLQNVLLPVLMSDNQKLFVQVLVLLTKICKAYPPPAGIPSAPLPPVAGDTAAPATPPPGIAAFYSRLLELAEQSIQAYVTSSATTAATPSAPSTPAVPSTPGGAGGAASAPSGAERSNVHNMVLLLKAITSHQADLTDRFVPWLVRLLYKLTKDLTSVRDDDVPVAAIDPAAAAAAAAAKLPVGPTGMPVLPGLPQSVAAGIQAALAMPPPSVPAGATPAAAAVAVAAAASRAAEQAVATAVRTIRASLAILNARPMTLVDHKKMLLQSLAALLEKSGNMDILSDIATMVASWVIPKDGTPPPPLLNGKEKALLLLKMMRFDKLGQPKLLQLFLEMVYHVATDPRGSDTAALEPAFMAGLRNDDPTLRARFAEFFSKSLPKPLSQRLHHVFAVQNWAPLADYYWVKVLVDLLLAVVTPSQPIQLDPTVAQVPVLLRKRDTLSASSGSSTTRSSPRLRSGAAASPTPLVGSASPEAVHALLKEHEEFLSQSREVGLADVIIPLRELAHTDASIASTLWQMVFPRVWGELRQEEQIKLERPLMLLLAKDYHVQQQKARPNVVKTLLKALRRCKPAPELPVELVKFLGKAYNAWYVVVDLLEERLRGELLKLAAPTSGPEPMAIDAGAPAASAETAVTTATLATAEETGMQTTTDALAELYQLLSEEDLYYGLLRLRAVAEETKGALMLQQLGQWQRAQEGYYHAMARLQAGQMAIAAKEPAVRWEIGCMEEHWLHCAKRLYQWELLVEYARTHSFNELQLDAAWKVLDWTAMRDAVMRQSFDTSSPQLKLYQAMLSIHDAKPQDVDALCNQAVALSLEHWVSLPRTPMVAHIPLLQSFQQILELQESAKIVKDISNTTKHATFSDVRAALALWRERLPNRWEDFTVWTELLLWRQYVFTFVNSAYQPFVETNATIAFIGHHETAWSINKFSHVARKHKLVEACLNALSKIYTLPNIEIYDAFMKLREQLKCYFQLPSHYRTGLDIINTTNLDFFTPPQRAEFFQLKGEFFVRLGQREEANAAFSTSVTLYDGLGAGWASWGRFCEMQYHEARGVASVDPAKRAQWAEYAVTSFMMAIRVEPKLARKLLPRVWWLITVDQDDGDGDRLAKTAERCAESAPLWIYVQWVPQLLDMLARPAEAPWARHALAAVARAYPQALFYPLRTFILEQRRAVGGDELASIAELPTPPDYLKKLQEEAAATATTSASTTTPPPPAIPTPSPVLSPLQHAEELAGIMRHHHPQLMADLEKFARLLLRASQLEPQEWLLTTAQQLLRECYKYIAATVAAGKELPPSVPKALKDKFERARDREFEPQPGMTPRQTVTLSDAKAVFVKEILSADTLAVAMERLHRWRQRLQADVDALPATVSLEAVVGSAALDVRYEGLEVPGQYDRTDEPVPEMHAKIERVHVELAVVRNKEAMGMRVLSLLGSDGRMHSLVLQPSIPLGPGGHGNRYRTEERVGQLVRLFNHLLNKQIECKRRYLVFARPELVAVSPRLKLWRRDAQAVSLEEIYADYCARAGKDFDAAYAVYREKVFAAMKDPTDGALTRAVRDAFQQITNEHTHSGILNAFLARQAASMSELYIVKKRILAGIALYATAGYALGIGDRDADRVFISLSTGIVWQAAFYPEIYADGAHPSKDAVPFRFGPNLKALLEPVGSEGIVQAVMLAAAHSFADPSYVDHYHVFFRDEIAHADTTAHQRTTSIRQASQAAVAEVTSKLQAMANQLLQPSVIGSSATGTAPATPPAPAPPVNAKVVELLQAATAPTNLALMPASWLPWM